MTKRTCKLWRATLAAVFLSIGPVLAGEKPDDLTRVLHYMVSKVEPTQQPKATASAPATETISMVYELAGPFGPWLKRRWEANPQQLWSDYRRVASTPWVRERLLYQLIGKAKVATELSRARLALTRPLPFENDLAGSWFQWSKTCYVELLDQTETDRDRGCRTAYLEFMYGPYDPHTARVVSWLMRRSQDMGTRVARTLRDIGKAELEYMQAGYR